MFEDTRLLNRVATRREESRQSRVVLNRKSCTDDQLTYRGYCECEALRGVTGSGPGGTFARAMLLSSFLARAHVPLVHSTCSELSGPRRRSREGLRTGPARRVNWATDKFQG